MQVALPHHNKAKHLKISIAYLCEFATDLKIIFIDHHSSETLSVCVTFTRCVHDLSHYGPPVVFIYKHNFFSFFLLSRFRNKTTLTNISYMNLYTYRDTLHSHGICNGRYSLFGWSLDE